MSNRTRIRSRYGVTDYAWRKLRDCEKILHKWSEDECNGRIQWDDDTGEPHLYRKDRWGSYTAKDAPHSTLKTTPWIVPARLRNGSA